MQDLFEELGLTAYEAKALEHLVRHGVRTGPDLSRETGIPFGRVYDTLNTLAEKGLVEIQGGRPKAYVAMPPATLPGRLLAANRLRLQHEEEAMTARVGALEKGLAALRPVASPARNTYGVRMGEDSAREFLVAATHEAKGPIVAYLAFGRLVDDDMRIFEAFRHAVARGVHTRLLLRAADVDYLLSTPYVDQVLEAMLPHLGQNLEARLAWDEAQPFSVLDGERAMIGIKNPLDPDAYFAVLHVEDPAFSQGLAAKFDAMWEAAQEPRDLIQWALGKKGGKALLKFGARLRGGGRD